MYPVFVARYISGTEVSLKPCTTINDVKVQVALRHQSHLAPNVIVLDPDTTDILGDDATLEAHTGQRHIFSVVLREVLFDDELLKYAFICHAMAHDSVGIARATSLADIVHAEMLLSQALLSYLTSSSSISGDVAKLLIDAKADAQYTPAVDGMPIGRWQRGWWNRVDSVLHIAAQRGADDVVQVLLDAACAPDMRGYNDVTPLHLAAQYKQTTTVALLLSEWHDKNDKHPLSRVEELFDAYGRTVLHSAVLGGSFEAVKLVLEANASLVVDEKDFGVQSPLLIACDRNEIAIVELLLTTGKAAVNSVGTCNRTSLHWAAFRGHAEVCQVLIAHNANIHMLEGDLRRTVLHNAVAYVGNMAVVRLLLEHQASVHKQDRNGMSALDYAQHCKLDEIVRIFLEQ
eukprot:GEMP01022397.1.p1 GENE.GEMP01022397.1~~GEMP01022397.1.p1  ORF type:complete len:402 (+),score=95.85 GEMP01022397.1:230-1435(+)